ncbi:MAG: DUF2809 domain-containing protein, partial [Gemmatimonadetes bacterium]|nr:DUF2809 domain-containing protein [Gemmatimonadota bacterium]
GGFLYVVFWVVLVLTLRPGLSERRVAGAVLAVTCVLEFLQLWHPPFLEAARRPFLGQALLGSHFSWSDFPYYVAGAWAAAAVVRLSSSRDRRACGTGAGTPDPSAAGRGSTGGREHR